MITFCFIPFFSFPFILFLLFITFLLFLLFIAFLLFLLFIAFLLFLLFIPSPSFSSALFLLPFFLSFHPFPIFHPFLFGFSSAPYAYHAY